ncbi:hypothetical protein QP905_10670 [Corynebacterium pseudodiphtheriticum]|uniref:hypothetical protein n=1 Tax=Corynebacterium pseudodiphtheriticum TaxID=37637 RepID=UPI002550B1DA|nr:hypothetical protein [Corynebacterium pseudodiphtheriticum]MDK8578801.1 hypothetical protein [Corynebacterium pseudodiphtheriticum]
MYFQRTRISLVAFLLVILLYFLPGLSLLGIEFFLVNELQLDIFTILSAFILCLGLVSSVFYIDLEIENSLRIKFAGIIIKNINIVDIDDIYEVEAKGILAFLEYIPSMQTVEDGVVISTGSGFVCVSTEKENYYVSCKDAKSICSYFHEIKNG